MITSNRIEIPEKYVLYSTTDLRGTILSASDDFAAISGYTKEEMVGKPHNMIRHPSVPKQVFADMWATLKAGETWSATVVNRTKSGQEYWVNANASPIVENGRVTGYISVRVPSSETDIREAQEAFRLINQGKLVLKNSILRKPFDVHFDWFRNLSISKKIMLPIITLFVIGGFITANHLNSVKEKSILAAGENASADMITMAKNSRTFYMQEIVPKVKDAGMKLSHLYQTHPTDLPLAANMMMALGEMSKQSGDGDDVGEVKLFSAYPFKFRGEANLDVFESEALAALQRNPEQPYIQIEENDGKSYFRMAVPDFMTSKACLNCHNHDPNSVKTDWKIGDVRGAISAKIPMGDLEVAMSKPIVELEITLAIIATIIVSVTYLLILMLRNRLSRLRDSVEYVEQSGDLTKRVTDTSRDAVGLTINKFNSLQNYVLGSVAQLSATSRAMGEGNFSQKAMGAKGSFTSIQNSMNKASSNLDFTMNELAKVMKALEEGEFDVTMDSEVPIAFRSKVDRALKSIRFVMSDIVDVMKKMEEGDFQQRVEAEAYGELAILKKAINTSLDTMSSAISQISEVVTAQASGDLTVSLSSGQFNGELNDLKNAINHSVQKLKDVVAVVSQAGKTVNAAARDVQNGANGISQRAQAQAASLEETSATMEQMNATIQQNTDNTEQSTKLAKEVQQKARTGTEVMSQTIEAMSAIQQSSHKISDIVTMIDGIAFQTNLLALNAAVEAARAGEHGRGFAVVAGEVRSLAQKSAEAAKDIKQLITESVGLIEEGSMRADESGEALNGITESIDEVASLVSQIANATKEQAAGMHQVHDAVTHIDGVTQQNVALVEETSSAAQSLSHQSNLLRQEVKFFKTENRS